ncbi:MAG: putative toxin-antitoxin system toxin component, PIN family [Thermomicrobiales bacterium]
MLDTNVWVSGLLFKDGIPSKLVDLVIEHQVRSFHADPILVRVITDKDSDNRILECAVEAGADMIVTGDQRHLLVLGNYKDIPILLPREAYDRVTQAESTGNS